MEESARYDQYAPNYSSSSSTIISSIFEGNSPDDTSTRDSVLSYSSTKGTARLLKQVDGRQYNALNDSYFLPSDETEWARLDKQHVAFTIGMKGLVPCPDVVDACLAPCSGVTRKILDLGTGTGVWATAMAQQYPHCQVVGIDLAPAPIEPFSVPRNCRFEVDDVGSGLHHYYDQFDVVHARLISSGIRNYPKMMEEVELCLKPGGVAIFIDYDAMFCAEDQVSRQPMAESSENGSWLVRCAYEMRNGSAKIGNDVLGMEVSLDEGLWDHEMMDPETAKAASLFLPIGSWTQGPKATEEMRFAGTLIRQDYTSAFHAVLGVYRRLGVPQEVIDEWRPKVEQELYSSKPHMWSRTRMAWARRRAEIDEPAPPLQLSSISYQEPAVGPSTYERCVSQDCESTKPYRLLHVYETQEECLTAARLRNESLPNNLPEPWCLRNRSGNGS